MNFISGCTKLRQCAIPASFKPPSSSSKRPFSYLRNKSYSENDPFGFKDISNFGEPNKFTKGSSSSDPVEPSKLKSTPHPAESNSSPPLGTAIFRRMAQDRQNQLFELQRFEERNRLDRNEKATHDQIWSSISQLKVQHHSGPLTPASSRVVRTTRIPPNSFLSRPILASDFERAYKKLQAMLNAAGLKKEIYLNKRYEKPFLKRRRLRSERHRRRFAIEVQRRVQIIGVMKLKGM